MGLGGREVGGGTTGGGQENEDCNESRSGGRVQIFNIRLNDFLDF